MTGSCPTFHDICSPRLLAFEFHPDILSSGCSRSDTQPHQECLPSFPLLRWLTIVCFWSRNDHSGLSLCYFPCCKLLIRIHANYHFFYQQTNCSIFSLESLLMQASMLMCTNSFFIQNSLRAHIFTPAP